MAQKTVVVTGMGVLAPNGLNVPEYWDALVNGKSGIALISKFDVTGYPTQIAGELKGFDPLNFMDKKIVRRLDPFIHYALAAVKEAADQAGLTREAMEKIGAPRCGVVIGSGIGGMKTYSHQQDVLTSSGYRKVSPFFIPSMITNMAAGMVGLEFGCQGPNFSISTACASASHSISAAINLIRKGDADLMICGGSEAAVEPLALAGFMSEKAISTRNDAPQEASRPFDRDRDGFVMGEGAGVLILETLESAQKRGVPILAEAVGSGASCDAYHMTAPREDGGGAALAIRNALADADIKPEEVDYVNTHGTSTPLGDKGEIRAIKQVFDDHAYKLKINSTKSMTGHLLGAAGGIEAVACVKTLETGIIHPTSNLTNPDEEFDLDIVGQQKIEHDVHCAISNSFGFGGHNACVVFKRYEK